VQVSFDIDANGLLQVSATDRTTGRQQSVTIQGGSNLSEQEIAALLAEAELKAVEDRRKRGEIDRRNKAQTLVAQAERRLRDAALELGPYGAERQQRSVEMAVRDVQDLLAAEDAAELELAVSQLQEALFGLNRRLMSERRAETGPLQGLKNTLGSLKDELFAEDDWDDWDRGGRGDPWATSSRTGGSSFTGGYGDLGRSGVGAGSLGGGSRGVDRFSSGGSGSMGSGSIGSSGLGYGGVGSNGPERGGSGSTSYRRSDYGKSDDGRSGYGSSAEGNWGAGSGGSAGAWRDRSERGRDEDDRFQDERADEGPFNRGQSGRDRWEDRTGRDSWDQRDDRDRDDRPADPGPRGSSGPGVRGAAAGDQGVWRPDDRRSEDGDAWAPRGADSRRPQREPHDDPWSDG
jgi:molecular chaperone DnaK